MFEKLQNLYWKIVPYYLRPKQLWYAFTCWAYYRYSTVKSRYLDHQWIEKEDLLVHCMFEVLCRFEIPDRWDEDERQEVKREILDLRRWWYEYNILYPKLNDKLWEQLRPYMFEITLTDTGRHTMRMNFVFKTPEQEENYDKINEYIRYVDQRYYDDLDINLERILKIRHHLST